MTLGMRVLIGLAAAMFAAAPFLIDAAPYEATGAASTYTWHLRGSD